jgi:hypothetical protein
MGLGFRHSRERKMTKWKTMTAGVVIVLVLCFALLGLSIITQLSASEADGTGDANHGNPSILAAHLRKGPYLIYPGQQDQMRVLWQLDSTATCTLEWGTDSTYSLGNVQTSEYGTDHQHSYTITGLTPRTHYFYKVTLNDQSKTGSFYSAPDSTATRLKFMAYGDTRSYPSIHNQVAGRIIATYNQDSAYQSLLISVGDLVNNGDNESDWDAQFFNASYPNIQTMLSQDPYQSAMGNHEGSGVLFAKYFPYPFVAGRYWSFDYGPAHFTVIDQYTSYTPGSDQLQWIENDLASTSKLWKFLVFHEPGWSAGDHPNNIEVQNYIQPLCIQYGVSIVFAGHNHYYARALVSGIEHITTGGGGAPIYQPDPGYPHIVSTAMAYHVCKIEIDGPRLNFVAINTSGYVLDSFSLGLQPGVISGSVLDPDGSTPLEGAIVSTLDTLNAFAGVDTTNSFGAYTLTLSQGVYHQSFSYPPYPDTSLNNLVVVAGETTFVSMIMPPENLPQYATGDVNGSGSFNGLDVTFSVAYFKGGPLPPYSWDCVPHGVFFVAGDVNASCNFNGLDVTYMVAYLKGGPQLQPCPDCPPR